MTDTPDRHTPDADEPQLGTIACPQEIERHLEAAAARFRRNTRLLCAGSVEIEPFEYGERDER
ncbi:MAG: hypothetical protein IT445_04120 [Phycisphaeraceae bacterium]|nr:hypothetical protein [Phycisphaeraceae bacterium]